MLLRVVATALVWEFPSETEIDGLGEGLMLTGGAASVWVEEKSINAVAITKRRVKLRSKESGLEMDLETTLDWMRALGAFSNKNVRPLATMLGDGS